MLTTAQGELAYRLVKRLYGRTNKRDATKQIGWHVIQVECAQLAADRQTINKQSQTTSVNDNIDQDLEKHYQISKTWKDPLNIYDYIYANPGDPAFDISPCVPCTYPRVSIWGNHQ